MDYSSPRRDDSLNSLLSNISVVSRGAFCFPARPLGSGSLFGMNQALAREPKSGGKPIPQVTDQDRDYMRQAIQLMRQAGVVDKTGGPFGAVVVRDGKVLAASGNSVVRDNDPSAHAEVNAIRIACRAVGALTYRERFYIRAANHADVLRYRLLARVSKISTRRPGPTMPTCLMTRILARTWRSLSTKDRGLQQIMQGDAQKVWQDFRKIPNRVRY